MCTTNPAKAIGADHRLGTLAVGRQADISVLHIHDGDWVVYDVLGASLRVQQAVVPVLAVKRGEVFMRDWGPRPWGWEPDQAPVAETGFVSCC
jgi:predicted amidohydrolase